MLVINLIEGIQSMSQQPRDRLEEADSSQTLGEISRSLAGVLKVSVQVPEAERGSDVVVMHRDAQRDRSLIVTRTARRTRQLVPFEAKRVRVSGSDVGMVKASPVDVAAYFRAANARQAAVLAEMLPRVLDTIEGAQKEVDEAHFREQVKALELLVPKIEPTFDPRLRRVGEALRLQNEFMERESVLTSADVAKHAGFSRRNLSHTASRWRKAGKIFSVSYRGKDFFPSFQFADDGQPWPSIPSLLATLRTGDTMTDWDIAVWFTTPNGWLSGKVPKALLSDLSKETVARLQRAAEQEVAPDDE